MGDVREARVLNGKLAGFGNDGRPGARFNGGRPAPVFFGRDPALRVAHGLAGGEKNGLVS